jgi:dipeptidyl-peptidase 4
MLRCPVLLFILALSGICPVHLRGSDELNEQLKRIFDSETFSPKGFGPARWIEDGNAFTTVERSASHADGKDIVRYETATGQRTVLVNSEQLMPKDNKPLAIDDYRWSPDSKKLLVFTESKKVWRQNTRGDYWLLDRTNGALRKLGGNAPASSLMFAKFSPDGSRVAYVRENNLYIEDLATGAIRALTSDGSATLVNGTSDWVYEEELNLRDGFRWSPDGRSIAFWQFDSTGVEQFALINNTDSLYPKITNIPYPKAGTKNSSVRIGVVSAEGGAPRWMQVPGDPRENYLFRMDWVARGGELAIGQLNRKQDTAVIFLADAKSGAVKEVFRDHDEAWVDIPDNEGQAQIGHFDWLNGGKKLLWLSDRDGWRHAYSVRDRLDPVPLTPDFGDVINLQRVDPGSEWMYFIASPGNATQRYLYRSSVEKPGRPVRLTPESQPGTHAYRISPNCHWAFHTYSRYDRPPVTELVSLPEHRVIRTLEGNAVLRAAAASLVEPAAEFVQVPVADGIVLDGLVVKPRNFDPARKYPVIVFVYGEPASATVVDSWAGDNGLFLRALANEGYLVVSFDNRGTPSPKGRAWRKVIYGSVGVLSSQEQTEAVLALAKQRPYVDLSRVGVWGWSGGGTNTLNLMFRSPALYRVGVAVAPVPDQKLYDTIYQERYMGRPDENPEGYHTGSAINFAEGLTGKLLIVHGSGDDNVHFQGTQKLVNRLIELGKPFDFMEYPNRTHSISEGEGTSLHVYSLIARYFEEHLPAGPR